MISAGAAAAIPAGRSMVRMVAGAAVALAVVLVLANPPDAHRLLFFGGKQSGLFGLAMAALVPLTIMVQIGCGAALARMLRRRDALQRPWLLWLSGSALTSLVGVAFAMAGMIGPWTCGGFFVVAVAWTCINDLPATSDRLASWVSLGDITANKPIFAVVRVGIIAALVMICLRAATGELNDTDVVQFYWGWLNEVRHLGGVWLSPELPTIQDFAQGRGNGNYLLAAGFAPGLVSHPISAAFCVMLAVSLRLVVLRAIGPAVVGRWPITRLAADLACFAALWMLPGAVAFGKYHLQYAAWAFGVMLVCLQLVTDDDGTARTWRLMLIPVVVAIPIGLPQLEALIVLVVASAILIAPDRRVAISRLSLPLLLGGLFAALSLLANWFYMGIPELNPFPLFERFIAEQRFDRWTSRLAQYYINYIQGGALTLNSGDGVGAWRKFRSLFGEIEAQLLPIGVGMAALFATSMLAMAPMRRPWGQWTALLLGVALGYVFYRLSLHVTFTDLALLPPVNQLLITIVVAAIYLLIVWLFGDAASRPFMLGLLAYWLICATFVLVFHSGSMGRLMRHTDVIGVGLLLVGLIRLVAPVAATSLRVSVENRTWRFRAGGALVPILIATTCAISLRAATSAAAIDPPRHLLASTLGLRGRAAGLTNPMAKFERCDEIARNVPADARLLFLNAYTAMAYCNNAVLLPRTMIVTPHASDYAREIATASFVEADAAEQALRRLRIDHFLVLKGDTEFWTSGLSAPFRPEELARRFALVAETPSFYVLGWRNAGGTALPANAIAEISEWRRLAIQQSGFMIANEFVGQWRAMANLGADRPKVQPGTPISFSATGWSALYADHGWYAAEPHGTWTVGPVAKLTLPLAKPEAGVLHVRMEVMPFSIPQLPPRVVHVKLGATSIVTWTFTQGDYQVREFDLPAGAASSGQIGLTFEIENAVSQYALDLNADWRPLGIAVRSLTFYAAR